jgi:co-chaperonin GroES (HSP10)
MNKQNKTKSKRQDSRKNSLDITKINLWGDLILLRAIRPESVSGLVNPEQYEEKPEWGEIVQVGEDVLNPRAQKGAIVRFGKYSSESVRSNSEDYFLVHLEDISGNLP